VIFTIAILQLFYRGSMRYFDTGNSLDHSNLPADKTDIIMMEPIWFDLWTKLMDF